MAALSSSFFVSLRRLAEYCSLGELTWCAKVVVSRSTAKLPEGELVSSAKISTLPTRNRRG
jgi:hypothetical protein